MSESSFPHTAERRSALVSQLEACGLRVEARAGHPGMFAAGIATRCVEVVGDQLTESLWLEPDGRLRYEAGWLDVMPFEDLPDFSALPAMGPYAPPTDPEALQPHPDWRVVVEPAGDPAGRYALVTIEAALGDPADLAAILRQMRALAARHNPAPGAVPPEAASYYLLAPEVVAIFQETIEDRVVGWGTFEVVAAEAGPVMGRATVEQADSRGDRYRYDVIRTAEGVAAEIRGKQDLVVHDWIWRFPIVDRDWTEEVDGNLVSLQVYHVDGPVDVAAGRFWGCVRLSTLNENGSSVHTYHPTAGLILSEFTDAAGTPGRRELFDLERRVP